MPIQDRRYYILKHNEEQERRKKEYESENGGTVRETETLMPMHVMNNLIIKH